VGLIEKLKAGLLLKRAADRIKEAHMKGGFKAAAFGLATAVVGGVIAKVTETCPTLIPNLWPIVGTGALAGIALWMKSPKEAPKP